MNKKDLKALVKETSPHEVVVILKGGKATTVNLAYYTNTNARGDIELAEGQDNKVDSYLCAKGIVKAFIVPKPVNSIKKPLKKPVEGADVSLEDGSLVDSLDLLSSDLEGEKAKKPESKEGSKSIADLMAGSDPSKKENSET